MIRQGAACLSGEGNAWFRRNQSPDINPAVISAIAALGIQPKRILEIGCGTGKYLEALRRLYGCLCIGIDPSQEAIAFGRTHYPELELYWGSADTIFTIFRNQDFDLIIFGFCLYVMDRDGLFDIVASTDVLLKDNGYIAIHDFNPARPEKIPYHHKEGLFSYKMRYDDLRL